MSDTARYELQRFRQFLQQLEDGSLSPHGFSDSARSQEALLAALPARYGEVLLGLLDRLETGALFTEESCSFSHKDLHDNLQLWADKAGQQLQSEG
ncbi:hypothetical protein [Diaphorobacter aerolatus]|uniref:Uncharacterized protein n=1 Tax=Diaphorobacter aerolatus TaxID=1288495 RepID=A0A7H0GH26_9BURK|nr:hypothetical protein [Diaphorobacter aerolatus]QNP47592.1 hypothetical protein H9K75_15305 [Diaphorobacter aerolatus]